MSRGFLRWFYLAVQFVMLAVSIPKVAMLFHAYDVQTLGPLIGGVDIRSWLVGIAIDLTATFTTWAAMAKYDESRTHSSLFAPGLIVLLCTALSVIANYEDAAMIVPPQYAQLVLFGNSALFLNPILISAPPVLVLLLILLVPSVLARARVKRPEEIAAEAAEQEALIAADARLREARAQANARVRQAQLGGFADTVGAAVRRARSQQAPAGEELLPLHELPAELPIELPADSDTGPKVHIVQGSRPLQPAAQEPAAELVATTGRGGRRGRKPAATDGGLDATKEEGA